MKLRQLLSQPTALVLLVPWVLFDGWFWATRSPRHVPIAAMCCAAFVQLGHMYHPHIPRAFVIESENGLRVVDIWSPEGEAIAKSATALSGVRAQLICFSSRSSVGLFAPVIETLDYNMSVTEEGDPLSASERAAVRSSFAQVIAIERRTDARVPALLAVGDGKTTFFKPLGLIHDLIMLFVLIACIWSLYLCLSSPAFKARAARKRAASLAAKLCPACKYDLSGIVMSPQLRCPECGEKLIAEELSMLPD